MRLLRRCASTGAALLLIGGCANAATTTAPPARTASPIAVVPATAPPSAAPLLAAPPSAAPPSAAPAPAPATTVTTSAIKPLVIHIRNYAYLPAAPVVAVGQPIEIVNDDDVAHTWSAAPKSGWTYTSGNLDKGQRTTFRGFAKPGAYPFVCFYHAEMPSMTGVTTVVKGP